MKVPELLAEPWSIARPAFDSIVQTAREGGSIGHVKAAALGVSVEALGRLLEGAPESQLDVRDGIAVIPVAGYLTRRPYWRGDQAAYEWIGEQVSAAHERRDVRGIVLEVDSRGGQVNGTDELARLIRDVRADKPVTAYVLGQAASAAYWIASAASRIVVGRTSMVGSVGVMMTFIDWSKYDAELGIQEITIVSSQSPDKDLDPSTESGRALVQATVDQLAGVFVADVAEGRGVDESKVISDFGQGWVLVGEEAVAAGMADRVGTFAEAITEVLGLESETSSTIPAAAGQEVEVKTIDITKITAEWLQANLPELFASMNAAAREGYVAQADHDSAVTAARNEQNEAASTASSEAAEAAASAERERVLEIQAAAKGAGQAELVAKLVADPTVTVESAKARLFEAAQAKRKGQADAFRQDEAELDAPDPDDGGGSENASEAKVARIVEAAKRAGIAG